MSTQRSQEYDTTDAAFPIPAGAARDGISYRQYLIAAALTGLVSHPKYDADVKAVADHAVKLADAVISRLMGSNSL